MTNILSLLTQMSINQRIRLLFIESGLSVNAFAKLINVSQPGTNKILNFKSEPKTKTLETIINSIGVDSNWLYQGEGVPFPDEEGVDKLSKRAAELSIPKTKQLAFTEFQERMREMAIGFKKISDPIVKNEELLRQTFDPLAERMKAFRDIGKMAMETTDPSETPTFAEDTPRPKAYASSSAASAENITAKAAGSDAIPLSDSEIKSRLGRNQYHVKPYEVQGDSMAPTLRQGDTVYCTDEPFRHGYIHVVEYKGGTIIKRLERGAGDYYVAISDNAAYPRFRITDDEIVQIWLVKCKLSYNLSGPGSDLNSRLQRLEQLLSPR